MNLLVCAIARRWLLAGFLLVGGCVAARAQGESEPHHDVQWWPDTQVSVRLNDRLNLLFFGPRDFRRGAPAVWRWSWSIQRRLSASLQYRYVVADPTERRHSTEHRILADLTPRLPLGQGFSLLTRSRAVWRRINGVVAGRFDQRVQLERPFNFHEHGITAYVAGETFFDTRTHAFSRTRSFMGTRIPLDKHLTLDGFYGHQWDARARPGFWHVRGTFLRFEF